MQLPELMEQISKLSLYEIWRLNAFASKLTEDGARLKILRHALRPGMRASFFCWKTNGDIPIVIDEVRQANASVREIETNKAWTISIASINTRGLDIKVPRGHKKGSLSKANLRIGDVVGFEARGSEVFGHVIKLNPKRALVQLPTKQKWNVSYTVLFPVCDGELGAEMAGCIEGEVVERSERSGDRVLVRAIS